MQFCFLSAYLELVSEESNRLCAHDIPATIQPEINIFNNVEPRSENNLIITSHAAVSSITDDFYKCLWLYAYVNNGLGPILQDRLIVWLLHIASYSRQHMRAHLK